MEENQILDDDLDFLINYENYIQNLPEEDHIKEKTNLLSDLKSPEIELFNLIHKNEIKYGSVKSFIEVLYMLTYKINVKLIVFVFRTII